MIRLIRNLVYWKDSFEASKLNQLGFSHFTQINIQPNIWNIRYASWCLIIVPYIQVQLQVPACSSKYKQLGSRIQTTAGEGTMEDTRLYCFEKAATDASIMFSLSFLNTMLFGVAAVAFEPALYCVLCLPSLQELLVYQLSSNSFHTVFFFCLSSHPPSSINHFIRPKAVLAWNYELKDYWSCLFL